MPSDRHHHSHRRNGRRRHPLHRSYRDFASRRRRGWGFNLYRNTRRGRIGGVAAGLADYWDVAPWVVRLGWIALFLFTGTLALWLYLGAWIALAPRPTRDDVGDAADPDEPAYEDAEVEMEYDERRHHYRPRKVFRYSDSSWLAGPAAPPWSVLNAMTALDDGLVISVAGADYDFISARSAN